MNVLDPFVSSPAGEQLPVPSSVVADRGGPIAIAIAGLPDPMLSALISGLHTEGDRLAPGRLFRLDGRACVIGAMLRQLHPAWFRGGRPWFLLRHSWRRRAASYGGPLNHCPRVNHLESHFDRAVSLMTNVLPDADQEHATRTVGRWLLRIAEHELGRRHDRDMGSAVARSPASARRVAARGRGRRHSPRDAAQPQRRQARAQSRRGSLAPGPSSVSSN